MRRDRPADNSRRYRDITKPGEKSPIRDTRRESTQSRIRLCQRLRPDRASHHRPRYPRRSSLDPGCQRVELIALAKRRRNGDHRAEPETVARRMSVPGQSGEGASLTTMRRSDPPEGALHVSVRSALYRDIEEGGSKRAGCRSAGTVATRECVTLRAST